MLMRIDVKVLTDRAITEFLRELRRQALKLDTTVRVLSGQVSLNGSLQLAAPEGSRRRVID
jgi:hypothetical protein